MKDNLRNDLLVIVLEEAFGMREQYALKLVNGIKQPKIWIVADRYYLTHEEARRVCVEMNEQGYPVVIEEHANPFHEERNTTGWEQCNSLIDFAG